MHNITTKLGFDSIINTHRWIKAYLTDVIYVAIKMKWQEVNSHDIYYGNIYPISGFNHPLKFLGLSRILNKIITVFTQ